VNGLTPDFSHGLLDFCTGEKNDVIHSGDRNFGLGLKLPEGELVLQANGAWCRRDLCWN
jgi:hypothetical protein